MTVTGLLSVCVMERYVSTNIVNTTYQLQFANASLVDAYCLIEVYQKTVEVKLFSL